MRAARMASLLALCLLIAGVQTKLHAQSNSRVIRIARSANSREVKSWDDIKGVGDTREDAENNAYQEARSRVINYFSNELNMPLEWTPTIEDIRRLVKTPPTDEQPVNLGADLGKASRVKLQMSMSVDDRNEFLKKDRDHRVVQRQIYLGKILAGLVVFLTAVAGYFRLDEATKGYYSGWLRLAALGLVGIVGAGIWWIS
jgi:hypothetical protein